MVFHRELPTQKAQQPWYFEILPIKMLTALTAQNPLTALSDGI